MYYSIALLNNPRVIVDMRDIPFAQDSHRRHLSAHIREAIRVSLVIEENVDIHMQQLKTEFVVK